MHLWTYVESGWAALPLEGTVLIFDSEAPYSVRKRRTGESLAGHLVLRLSVGDLGHEQWFLFTPEAGSVRTNGRPVLAGVHLLRDRDEIRLSGFGPSSFFFSTESLARVVPLSVGPNPVYCARCRQEILPECPTVKCPGCGMIHHQSGEFKCWSYSEVCAMCDQKTDLNTGFRWTPEEE